MKVRKKQEILEAEFYDGSDSSCKRITDMLGSSVTIKGFYEEGASLLTIFGDVLVGRDRWAVRKSDGRVLSVSKSNFAKEYEIVTEARTPLGERLDEMLG